MSCQLTLLVPGLLQPPQSLQLLASQEQPSFDLLNRFFSRARETQIPVSGFYASLFHLFGIQVEEPSDYPVAALTRLADTGTKIDEWSLRCDPVCIQADMGRAVLMGHGTLSLSETDAQQLVDIINVHTQQDGWQIEAPSVDRWYVKGATQIQLSTTPPLAVLGQDIKHAMPEGPDAGYWHSLMNECQMLLHEIPLNLARQEKGLLPINSLWFWGGGVLPEKATCPYELIYGDDPLLAGLAQHAGCAYEKIEQVVRAIQQQHDKQILVVIGDLHSPLTSQDLFYWLDAVKQFEQTIIKPLLIMLKDKQLSQVTVLSADGRAFQLTPKWLRHWWKRNAKFQSLLQPVSG